MKNLAVSTVIAAGLLLVPSASFAQYRDKKTAEEAPKTETDLLLEKADSSETPVVITLEQACTITKLDYHYFSRVFREKTGMTFVEYLSFIRILNAQKLLAETDEPISDIAKKVGIPNISYFNRKFKAQNGMTPGQYRKTNQKNN